MHPAWGHVRAMAEDPDAALDDRIEVARQSGVPAAALERYESRAAATGTCIDRVVPPDRELVRRRRGRDRPRLLAGAYETPGHAPSHVVLHQPESGLLISGDHLLGRISLFFDHGHTPDPVGEFLASLDEVDALDVRLCLPGHGRTFRDVGAKIAGLPQGGRRAARDASATRLARRREDAVRAIVEAMIGAENIKPAGRRLGAAALARLPRPPRGARRGRTESPGTDPVLWRLDRLSRPVYAMANEACQCCPEP